MLEFVSGLVLGAILGVIADRLWARFENRVRVQVRGSHSFTSAGQKGFVFKVRNVGKVTIPPYRISLFNPGRGSFLVFDKEPPGELLPQQEDNHSCWLIGPRGPDEHLCNWFSSLSADEISGFAFRLVMENSDRVLYENSLIGQSLVKQFVHVCQSGNLQGLTGIEAGQLHSRDRWLDGLVREWRRTARKGSEMLRDFVRDIRVFLFGSRSN